MDTEDEGTKILTKRETKNRNDVGLPSRSIAMRLMMAWHLTKVFVFFCHVVLLHELHVASIKNVLDHQHITTAEAQPWKAMS